jgi:hypothetical protein
MNLNTVLLIITGSMVVFGGGAAIWSHFDTKRKYGDAQPPTGEEVDDDDRD